MGEGCQALAHPAELATLRPLAIRTVAGMVVSEGAPVLGIALEPVRDGLVCVLVNHTRAQ